MNFEYSDEQQQLADSLRKYLANDYSFDKRKAIVQLAPAAAAMPCGPPSPRWA